MRCDDGKKVKGRRSQPSGSRSPSGTADITGFVVLPRRWVVERRTFYRFVRNPRLAKDHENLAKNLLAFVSLASTQLALRRRAHN